MGPRWRPTRCGPAAAIPRALSGHMSVLRARGPVCLRHARGCVPEAASTCRGPQRSVSSVHVARSRLIADDPRKDCVETERPNPSVLQRSRADHTARALQPSAISWRPLGLTCHSSNTPVKITRSSAGVLRPFATSTAKPMLRRNASEPSFVGLVSALRPVYASSTRRAGKRCAEPSTETATACVVARGGQVDVAGAVRVTKRRSL